MLRFGRYGARVVAPNVARPQTRARQRYVCLQESGDRHTFTEPLPRLAPVVDPRSCSLCERTFSTRDAPRGPRKHSFPLAEIARALVLVGGGWSYRSAGERVRRDAGIHRARHAAPIGHRCRDWALVADWVELFTPLLARELMPRRWPRSVVFDAVPFRLAGRTMPSGFPMHSGGAPAWSVLVAGGWDDTGRMRIYIMRAVPGTPASRDWLELMASLQGTPTRVVSDDDQAIRSAARVHWPSATLVIGWDKLMRRLRDADDSAIRKDRRHAEHDPIWVASKDAFLSRRNWVNFRAIVRACGPAPRTEAWIRRNRGLVRRQWRLEPPWPSSTGHLEQKAAEMRAMLVNRKAMFRNRDRTTLLLTLIALHQNGIDNVRHYTRLISEHLAQLGGQPPRHNRINRSMRLH